MVIKHIHSIQRGIPYHCKQSPPEKNDATMKLRRTLFFCVYNSFLNSLRFYVDVVTPHWAPFCWHTKKFHNSPKWSITKVYLSEDKLTKRRGICSPLCVLGTGIKSSSQENHTCISSAFIVHEIIHKVGWYPKGH